MQNVREFYTERVAEIDSFLNLIEGIQIASRDGPPRIGSVGEISADHQKILVSTAYIQLYSLVESTVGQTLGYISEYVSRTCRFEDLNDQFKREWVDYQAKNYNNDLTQQKRSDLTLRLSNHVSTTDALLPFKIEKRNAKGWDRKIVEGVAGRLGLDVQVSAELKTSLEMHYSDDMPPLTFLKIRRGQLAHGDISFVQSGEVKSIEDLRRLRDITCGYLDSMLNSFQMFLEAHAYRRVERIDDPANTAAEPAHASTTG